MVFVYRCGQKYLGFSRKAFSPVLNQEACLMRKKRRATLSHNDTESKAPTDAGALLNNATKNNDLRLYITRASYNGWCGFLKINATMLHQRLLFDQKGFHSSINAC